jgi:hypothetical protein
VGGYLHDFDQPGAGRADWVSERARSAVHVEPLWIDAEFFRGGHRHDGERLVDLEEVDIGDLPADPLEQLADRGCGGRRIPDRILRVGRVAPDLSEDAEAAAFGLGAPHEDERGRAIGVGGRARRRDRAVLAEGGLELGDLLGRNLERMLVVCDDRRAALHRDLDPRDLRGERHGARIAMTHPARRVRVAALYKLTLFEDCEVAPQIPCQ